jgi:hypothetical protein
VGLRLPLRSDSQPLHSIYRPKVEAYAQLYDLELVEAVVDAGASAKTLDRARFVRVSILCLYFFNTLLISRWLSIVNIVVIASGEVS